MENNLNNINTAQFLMQKSKMIEKSGDREFKERALSGFTQISDSTYTESDEQKLRERVSLATSSAFVGTLAGAAVATGGVLFPVVAAAGVAYGINKMTESLLRRSVERKRQKAIDESNMMDNPNVTIESTDNSESTTPRKNKPGM